MTAEIEARFCRMSPSAIDRLLHPWRRLGRRRPFTTTKPGSLLKSSIPMRTFAELDRVAFKDEVWPKFLRGNAAAILGYDPA